MKKESGGGEERGKGLGDSKQRKKEREKDK